MFLENDIFRNSGGIGPSVDPLRHHISPPGPLSGARLSPQDSILSDIDEFGRPCLPGVDPHFQASSAISNSRR